MTTSEDLKTASLSIYMTTNPVMEITLVLNLSTFYLTQAILSVMRAFPHDFNSHVLIGGRFKTLDHIAKAALAHEALNDVVGPTSTQQVSLTELTAWKGREKLNT